jgi:hypothetical protein
LPSVRYRTALWRRHPRQQGATKKRDCRMTPRRPVLAQGARTVLGAAQTAGRRVDDVDVAVANGTLADTGERGVNAPPVVEPAADIHF